MPIRRTLALALAACLATASCASDSVLAPSTPATTAPTTAPTTTSTTTTTIPRDCLPSASALPALVETTDAAAISVLLSAATFPCADEVTIALAGDPEAAAAAALQAVQAGGPLLLAGTTLDALGAEIERLGPLRITLARGLDPAAPALAGFATRPLPTGLAIRGGIVQGSDSTRLVVVGEAAAGAWPAVWAAIGATGDTAVLAGPDLRALAPARLAAIRSAAGASATLLGASEDADWQLNVVRSGLELPGGGLLMFPDRRLVAFYGHPETGVLGVLGEQGLDGAAATIDRMAPLVEAYAADGVLTIPAFEIIATVASAEATSDGNYSRETSRDLLRPWVETAGERGVYVILDLQPGRTDFLAQAKLYEEFLRLPHVGLAIDPEWRLKPDQVHLRQIGSVDAAEINLVAEWLASLVREEHLPQKLLLLHQFRYDMIPNREILDLHPELAVAVQMDGQGALADKYATWGVLTTQPDSGRLWWGWKNFYDEDRPMATPQEVFDLMPTVYLVSFQ
ncbi:MAG: hypothetical protein MUP76_10855 [Acidimicrobiia bacterium]|nr:hypothetical protein [Acidimicrobiia bacterium]